MMMCPSSQRGHDDVPVQPVPCRWQRLDPEQLTKADIDDPQQHGEQEARDRNAEHGHQQDHRRPSSAATQGHCQSQRYPEDHSYEEGDDQ
jgi:hypothetical protein